MTTKTELQKRIAATLREYWEGRPMKYIAAESVSNHIAAMAMDVVGPEVDSMTQVPPDAKTWLTAILYDASQQGWDVQTCMRKAEWLLNAWHDAKPLGGA